jgi:hypothetical protein
MWSRGIKFIALHRNEVLFIYRIFMENLFSWLLNANLFPSFLKRKIKIFKNLINLNSSLSYPPPVGLGSHTNLENTNPSKNMSPPPQTERKSFKIDWKVKRSLLNVLKIAYATVRIWKVMNNFAVTVWPMYGKVSARIVCRESNVVIVTQRKQGYAEIHKSRTREGKQ